MKRGELCTASAGGDDAGKPRPVLIVQDDAFAETALVTICSFTTNPADAPLFRLLMEPDGGNGLPERSRLMVDKVTTIPHAKLGTRIGRLADADLLRLNRSLARPAPGAGDSRPTDGISGIMEKARGPSPRSAGSGAARCRLS